MTEQNLNYYALLEAVRNEMLAQDKKWGADRDHDSGTWMMILGEEVGELNKALLEDQHDTERRHIEEAYDEAVQVAAVAVQVMHALRMKDVILRCRMPS